MIRYDEILVGAPSAAQIQHQPFAADGRHELLKPYPIQSSRLKNPGSNDHMRGALVQKSCRIAKVNSATDLQPARECAQGSARRRLVVRSKHDDVAAVEVIAFIELGE